MSTGDWPQDDNPAPSPAPKRSRATRIVLIILGIGGGSVLLCCGCLCIGPWLFPEQAASLLRRVTTFVDDPESIRERAQNIATIELPERYTPLEAFKFPLIHWNVVAYKAGEGRLLLTEFPLPFDPAAVADMDRRIRQNLSRSPSGRILLDDLDVRSSRSEERQIRGQQVVVKYSTGVVQKTNEPYHEVAVYFPGADGSTAALIIQLAEKDWDDAEIQSILDSIK